MKTHTINPPVGGYFKHEERIYKAIASDAHGCNGCCFQNPTCSAPIGLDCTGRIIKDVTGSKELLNVELIDIPAEKRTILPVVIFLLAFWTTVIIYLIN